MRALNFNFKAKQSDRTNDGVALRVGYILCDFLVVCGDYQFSIFIESTFEQISLRRKRMMLRAFYEHSENTNGLEILDTYERIAKQYNTIKHPPTNILVAFKKIENHFLRIYAEYVELMVGLMRKEGLTQLKDLIDYDTFDAFYISSANPETMEVDPSNKEMIASHFFLEKFPKKLEHPDIQLLPSEFFATSAELNHTIYTHKDPEATQNDTTYLVPFFTLPWINSFQTNELKLFRKAFLAAGTAFRNKLDEWLLMGKKPLEFPEKVHFLANEVLAAAAPLLQEIAQNPTLHFNTEGHLKEQAYKLQVYYGETTYAHLWQCQQAMNNLEPETWDVIALKLETPEFSEKRVPIMVVELVATKPEIIKSLEEQTSVTSFTKKSISLDF